MVYFAGENRLGDYMVYALKEMKSVGSVKDQLELLAQYASKWVDGRGLSPTSLPAPVRFHLKFNNNHPRESVVYDYEETSGDPPQPPNYVEELSDFIAWGISTYPADHYMVVLSGDGGGPVKTFLPSTSQPANALKAGELGQVFERAKEKLGKNQMIDVLGLDSCLMSMAEIGYEVRKHASLLVSSQGNEDDMGWPYRDILSDLKNHPEWTPRVFAQKIVEDYNVYYFDYAVLSKISANLSALDLSKFDYLADGLKAFTDAANDVLPHDELDDCSSNDLAYKNLAQLFAVLLVRAHWTAQSYRDDQYTDIYDFCDILERDLEKFSCAKLRRVRRACEGLKKLLCRSEGCNSTDSDDLVLKSCYVGVRDQYSHGLSLYFPWHRINEGYYPYIKPADRTRTSGKIPEDSFAKVTGWDEFLARYLCATRRPIRAGVSSDFSISAASIDKLLKKLLKEKDPPEGRDLLGECESTKNGPSFWEMPSCVKETIR